MEQTLLSKVDSELGQQMKTMKDDTGRELKEFQDIKLNSMDTQFKQIAKKVKELWEKKESRIEHVEEKNRKLVETVNRLEKEHMAMKSELQEMSGMFTEVKDQSIAIEQYLQKHNIRMLDLEEERGEKCVQKVIKAIDQGWPTSQSLRATLLLCYRKEPHHTHGHT